ncbi:MAG: glycosyltransferase family 39 protein [Candidatus Thermoplasmatota archaeon]|nr:glycosyltransferase family 39 protein [Candidatus Thermoplasmatota archaeon]
MALLQSIVADRRKLLATVFLIFLLAAFLRLYNIQWSYSNNGVDEGIMLMRAQMLGEGFELYSEIPCDQAPLALLVSAAVEGDLLASRLLSAMLSIAAIAACMEAAKRMRGEVAMLAAGLVLAVDFAFLRESRLFSLDGMSSYFLAFSLLPLLAYVRDRSRLMLAIAGALLGLSAASKLYGAIAVVGVLVFMLVEASAERRKGASAYPRVLDAVILVVVAVIPMVVLLALLGPSDMLSGMLFDQGHREFDLLMKLSIPLYFAFSAAYVLPFARARTLWTRSPETRLLLWISIGLLVNFILQPLAFLHNMVLMSPPLAILVGLLAADWLGHEKNINRMTHESHETKKSTGLAVMVMAIFVVGVVVSAGFASYGLAVQGRSPQQVYGEKIASWTAEDDWIISGDPLIAAYAERKVPLSMINMGTRIYPEITVQDVQDAIEEHDVQVVIVCYRLWEEDMAGLTLFLRGHGFSLVLSTAIGEWSKAAIETYVNDDDPWVFVSEDIVDKFDLPVWVWEDWLTSPA